MRAVTPSFVLVAALRGKSLEVTGMEGKKRKEGKRKREGKGCVFNWLLGDRRSWTQGTNPILTPPIIPVWRPCVSRFRYEIAA